MAKLTTWQATVQDDDTGAAVVEPVVTVRKGGPAGDMADLFDIAGSGIGNPVTGGTDGFVQLQAYPGRYWIQAADGGTFSQAWYWDAVPDDGLNWASRGDLVTDWSAGIDLPDGAVLSDGTVQYVVSAGATAITDLLGLLPFGDVYADHYEENTTPGTTDMGAAINQALQAHAVVKLRSEGVYFSSVPIVHTGVSTSLEGESEKRTTISFADFTEPAIQFQPSNVLDNVFRGNNRLANIQLSGNNYSSADRWAIRALKQEQVLIQNVRWNGFSYGIDIAGGQLNSFKKFYGFGSGVSPARSDSTHLRIRSAPNTSGTQKSFTCNFEDFHLVGAQSKGIRDIITVNQSDGHQFSNGYVSFGERSLLALDAEASQNLSVLSFDNVYFDGVNQVSGTPAGLYIPASGAGAGVVTCTFGSGVLFANYTDKCIDAGAADNIRELKFVGSSLSGAANSIGDIKGTTGAGGSRIEFIGGTIRDSSGGLTITDGRTLAISKLTATDILGVSPAVDVQGSFTSKSISVVESGNSVDTSDGATSSADVFYEWHQAGAFTPTMTIGGSSAGVTYSANSGSYTRIRNTVTLTLRVALSSKGGLTGDVEVRDLPFAAAGATLSPPVAIRLGSNSSLGSGVSGLSGDVVAGTTRVRLSKDGGTGDTALDGADITNTLDFRLSVTYQI